MNVSNLATEALGWAGIACLMPLALIQKCAEKWGGQELSPEAALLASLVSTAALTRFAGAGVVGHGFGGIIYVSTLAEIGRNERDGWIEAAYRIGCAYGVGGAVGAIGNMGLDSQEGIAQAVAHGAQDMLYVAACGAVASVVGSVRRAVQLPA